MANCIRCNLHRTSVESKQYLKERLVASLILMLCAFFGIVFSVITYAFDSVCPQWLRWRRTSRKELEEVDQKILKSLPCVQDQRMVGLDKDCVLWSVTCNLRGRGTPILLVHGMGGGVGLWAMNLEALSRHRPVYAFDLLGFGRSSRPKFPTSAREAEDVFVESIEKYRAAVGLDRFILLGHSLGGYLSASYALRYPQHVKHLVMVDPWGISPKPPDGPRRLHFLIRCLLAVLKMGYPLSLLRAAGPLGPFLVQYYRPGLAETFATKLGDTSLLHRYIYHCNAQNPSGEVGFTNMTWNLAWAKDPMIHRLHTLDPDIPITFLYGARSWVSRATGWKVKSSRDNSYVDVQIIRGAGHHVYADRWDLFNTLLETIAFSVDRDTLPDLDTKLVKRIHAAPTVPCFLPPDPNDPDFQRPLGHIDENSPQDEGSENSEEEEERKEDDGGNMPMFSLPHSS
ncbi:(Lyso)-N-acylphosphatidylethanolamine lipase-like [Babylonia areolata]|uniref:(Lyso)-N-acylphosphatidylethanolamine lipase-like n=1 Tax=Babylonia areolata TaxID=304850 RepID=UPI003FD67A4D